MQQTDNATSRYFAPEPPPAPDWLVNFYNFMLSQGPREAHLVSLYREIAMEFFRFSEEVTGAHVTIADCAAQYLRSLNTHNYRSAGFLSSAETQARLNVMDIIVNSCCKQDACDRRVNSDFLTDSEQKSLIEHGLAQGRLREVAVCKLMLRHGLTLAACHRLRICDLRDEGFTILTDEGEREMRINLSADTRKSLLQWIFSPQRIQGGVDRSDFVFASSNSDAPVTVTALNLQIRKLGWGIGRKVSARTLRNTWKRQDF